MDAKELNALVHDREAALYDDRFMIRYDGAIGRAVERDVKRLLGKRPSVGRALDVACGTGYLAVGLAAAGIAEEVHACDLSPKMLERTRDNASSSGASVRLALCDAERLPYADATFDLVCARGALHHVPSPVDALREMRRVLAPGGTAFVVAEPTAAGERQVAVVVGLAVRAVEGLRRVRRIARDEEHHQWELASMAANLHTFEPAEIAEMARVAGFSEVSVGSAAWAWVLVLGLNYYLAGEIAFLARNRVARTLARSAIETAAAFDRLIGDRAVPASLRHTVQAVLR
ncbi:MAG: class I SAM-dependent methyltransferase [Actinomycetota bacterium]|nr:class I SAM-dependent methyltransferase [Actinomycetota bacterium]